MYRVTVTHVDDTEPMLSLVADYDTVADVLDAAVDVRRYGLEDPRVTVEIDR